MWILMVYVLIVVIGEIVVVAIGLVLDRIHPVLQFASFLVAILRRTRVWMDLAVRWTEPKHSKSAKLAG